MKSFLFILIFSLLLACNSGKGKQYGSFQFDKMQHDFGNVKNGDTVSYFFKFKNVGDSALVIEDISSGCGCTVAEKPNSAILPADSGRIKVSFYKEHDPGTHTKAIIIKANTEDPYTVLSIKANVLE